MNMSKLWIVSAMALLVFSGTGCGGSDPKVQNPEDADDYDPIAAIVGDVEIDEADLEDEEVAPEAEAYTGPTKVTINLKVVNNENPKGSFKLMDSSGAAIIENGTLGDTVDLNQGSYTLEFRSALVFGDAVHAVDLDVAGKEMTVNEIFPAGQITLNTYRGKAVNRCVPTPFTLFNIADDEPVQVGEKGKTCKPLVIETGHYEVRLQVSKKEYQPVDMRINREQVQTSNVKLE